MSILIPVKKGLEEPIELVGHKGLLFSHLEESMKLPFSLIISSKVFTEFLSKNGLLNHFSDIEKNIHLNEEMVSLFQEATHRIMNGSFPSTIIDELREGFELASLDTNNPTVKKLEILSLRRSTSYVDEDDHIHLAKYTKNEFDDFLRAIKTCFASLYSPSSISQRLKQGISSFNCAIIVSRIPHMETCFESELNYHTNTIKVNSYTGFLDQSKIVPKDSFILSSDFLKVVHTSILRQDIVSIFDVTTNSIRQQKFNVQGSSQSATEQTILEIGRLTKKIGSQSSIGASIKAEFILDKKGNVICIDAMFKQTESKMHESIKPSFSNNISNNNEDKISDINAKTSLDISIKDNITNQETINLIEQLKSFLKENKHKSRFGPSIDIVLRALENETSKDTLLQAINLSKEIVLNWDD